MRRRVHVRALAFVAGEQALAVHDLHQPQHRGVSEVGFLGEPRVQVALGRSRFGRGLELVARQEEAQVVVGELVPAVLALAKMAVAAGGPEILRHGARSRRPVRGPARRPGSLTADDGGFDTDVAIATGEIARLLPDLIEALGGEAQPGVAASASASASASAPVLASNSGSVTGPATAPVDTDPDNAPF